MQQSNLFVLFQQFSPDEWKSFGKFLRSPYHNANKRLPVLHDYISRYYPTLAHPKLERKRVWQAVFGEDAAFDDAVLRVLSSAMNRAAEQFLAVEQFQRDQHLKNRLLASAFNMHALYPRFLETAQNTLQSIDKQPIKGMENLLDAFLLHTELHYHPETAGLTTDDHHLRSALARLNEFYALAKLRLSVELSARASLIQEHTEYPLLHPLREMLRNTTKEENPTLRLYLDLLEISFEGLTEQRFFELKALLMEHATRLDRQVQLEALIHLINYANRLTTKDNVLFFKELHALNSFGADHGLFLVHGVIPDAWFVNACVTGAVCKEWDWAAHFIETYSPQLRPEVAQDAVTLSQAFLLFYKKQFAKAYDLLLEVPDADFGYSLRRRMLGLRCLFEATVERPDFRDLLESQLATQEKFLSRQKVYSKERIAPEMNFCKALHKLLLLLSPAHDFKEQLDKLYQIMSPQNPVSARGWLLEKIAVFEERGQVKSPAPL